MVDYSRTLFSEADGNNIVTKIDSEVVTKTLYSTLWRVIIIGDSYSDLINIQYLILNLNDPNELSDTSWITPGKAIRLGLSAEEALNAIDFALEHNIQYLHYDAGWYGLGYSEEFNPNSVPTDPINEIDIQLVTESAYNVGLKTFVYLNQVGMENYDLKDTINTYHNYGIYGIKFGFVKVRNQYYTKWLHSAVRMAADYEMVIDIHDEYRPTGYSRTYPNLLTQEGILGDEGSPSMTNILISLYTRMLAGAADHTFCYFSERVTSEWSRATQLAKTVLFYSPLQFIYWYG